MATACSSGGFLGSYVPERWRTRLACGTNCGQPSVQDVGVWPAPDNCALPAWDTWSMNPSTGGDLGCQAPLSFTQIAHPRDVGYADSLMIQGNGYLTVNTLQSHDIRGDLPLPATVSCLVGASMPDFGPYSFATQVRGWGY